MEHSTISLSNTLSKKGPDEAVSLSWAAMEEAKSRPQSSITNEQIKKGDPVLETYRVVEDAVQGGMGNVWKVHHNTWNVDLAMKRPKPEFFAEAGEERKNDFIAECENWIKLGLHPNIVSCYYVREVGGVPTIFAEWMEKGSLKDRILDGTLYDGTKEDVLERVLDIAIQALRGLKFSHENGLIHQDIKPGNLLLASDWDAKVADFGLARAVSGLGKEIKDLPSGYTPAYCPAEQAAGAPVQNWMDTYAWALTVIEMLAGERFWGKGAENEQICSRIDQYLKTGQNTESPAALITLLKRCLLEKNVGDDEAEAALLSIYQDVTGNRYRRVLPDDLDTSVDNLNNKALSMLDLGMPMEARQIWNDAVLKDHRHVESIYNNALFLWRQAEIDGYEAYRRISETPPSENRTHFLDEILRESGCDEDHFSMEIKLPVVKIESMYDYDADRAGYMPRKNEKIPGNLDPAAVEQCRKYLGDLKGYTFELNQQGNLLAAGGRDGVIYVWSLPDMVLLFTGRSHRSEVMQLAFSHQGNMLVSFDIRREVRVWSIPDGRCVKNLYSVFFNMNRIAFSEDDSELKIYFHSFHRTFPIGPFTYKAPWYLCRIGTTEEAVNDRQLFRERMELAERARTEGESAAALDWIAKARALPGYEHDPDALALKRSILKSSITSEIEDTWEMAAFQAPEEYGVYTAVLGNSIYLLGTKKIYEYNFSGQVQRTFPSVVGEPTGMDISGDGKYLLAMGTVMKGEKEKVRLAVHDLSDGHVVKTLPFGYIPFILAANKSQGMFAVSDMHKLEVFSFPACRRIWKKNMPCLDFSWNRTAPILYVSADNPPDVIDELWVVSVKKWPGTRVKKYHLHGIWSDYYPAVSPDGKMCFFRKSTHPGENKLSCWDMDSAEERGIVDIGSERPHWSAYTDDSRFIAIGTGKGSISIFNCESLRREPKLRADTFPKKSVMQMAWNEDSSILVCSTAVAEKETRFMEIHVLYVDWKV